VSASVIVVAQLRDEALRATAAERLSELTSFYAPLGIAGQQQTWHPATRVVAHRIWFATPLEETPLWTWGEPLPPGLASAEAVIGADQRELDSIRGMTAAFAFAPERARIVSAASGPATLYDADGDGIWCCSTHAVAAGWVAHGDARVDPGAVPELLAFDFVGGSRTLIAGVRHLAPATSVAIDSGGRATTAWHSPAQRWELTPEPDAQQVAERELVGALEARLAGRSVSVALTAGLDSRVLAVALAESGISFAAFTWGAEDWPDTVGAVLVAEALGAPHSVLGRTVLEPDEILSEHDRAVRWADGVFALAPAGRTWPAADVIASGMGGETGRAFYYDRWSTWLWPQPPGQVLADRLSGRAHLPAANADAAEQADAAVAAWLAQAEQSGLTGWRLLDVVYADQRVRRWGRGQVPCIDSAFCPAFIPQGHARALVSKPLEERLTSGFHHTFLESRNPGLAPPRPAVASDAPAILRLPYRVRQRRIRARRPGVPVHQGGDQFLERVWAERQAARDWVLGEAVVHPLTGGALGQAWVDWVRDGFPRGAKRAGEHARLAAGVAGLDAALAELRRARRSSAS
jgi:hypothetical protein